MKGPNIVFSIITVFLGIGSIVMLGLWIKWGVNKGKMVEGQNCNIISPPFMFYINGSGRGSGWLPMVRVTCFHGAKNHNIDYYRVGKPETIPWTVGASLRYDQIYKNYNEAREQWVEMYNSVTYTQKPTSWSGEKPPPTIYPRKLTNKYFEPGNMSNNRFCFQGKSDWISDKKPKVCSRRLWEWWTTFSVITWVFFTVFFMFSFVNWE